MSGYDPNLHQTTEEDKSRYNTNTGYSYQNQNVNQNVSSLSPQSMHNRGRSRIYMREEGEGKEGRGGWLNNSYLSYSCPTCRRTKSYGVSYYFTLLYKFFWLCLALFFLLFDYKFIFNIVDHDKEQQQDRYRNY